MRKTGKIGISSSIIFTVFLMLVGCGSHRMIRTEPPGATIYVDGRKIGKSPIAYKFGKSGFRYGYKVRAELDGYYPEEEVIKSHTDVWGSVEWSDAFIRLRKTDSDERKDSPPKTDLISPKQEGAIKQQLGASGIEAAKKKLNIAFENGHITIEQLKKANSELKSQSISKILRVFV